MNGYFWMALATVFGVTAPFLFLRWRRGQGRETGHYAAGPAPPAPHSTAPIEAKRKAPPGFHGVTLKPCLEACEAVQALAGQRFLSSEAPSLPLADCDQQRCDCKYGHLSDRRDKGERRRGWDTFGGFAQTLVEGERRDKVRSRRN
jgi:hypothetical protein